jgi:hypothetical protein
VRTGYHVLKLLSGENIGGEEIALSMSVLSSLGNSNTKNLAWASLDHDKAALNENGKEEMNEYFKLG